MISGVMWVKVEFTNMKRIISMFRGFSKISIDSKGRLAIPSRYRSLVLDQALNNLVITLNPLDRSLWLYPLPEWELIEDKLAALSDFDKQSRRTKQMMRGYANDCQLDSQGRILIAKEYAELTRQAVILGQGNKFEIWNEKSWETQRDNWLESVSNESTSSSDSLRSLSL
jgi:MraZ protein